MNKLASFNQWPPMVSVIIPVYNDARQLQFCLESLVKQNYPTDKFEIIVVDNGSDQKLNGIVEQFDHTTLLEESTPGSYAARNLGISQAAGDVWAFIDSDIVASPNWLKEGVEVLFSKPKIGLVGGKIAFSFANEHHPTAVELFDSLTSFKQKEYIEQSHFSVTGNLFSCPEIFQDVGLFNKDLKSGGDREWGNRVHHAGYHLIYAHKAIVYHPARNSFKDLLKKHRRVAGGSAQKLFSESNYPLKKFLRSQLVEGMIFLRLCKEILFSGTVPARLMPSVFSINVLITLIRVLEPYRILCGGTPHR